MLDVVVGSTSAERVLLFLAAREEGYATEIARAYQTDLSPIQKQLERMEKQGLLINRRIGRIRLYRLNPEFHFFKEIQSLLSKALSIMPKENLERLSDNGSTSITSNQILFPEQYI